MNVERVQMLATPVKHDLKDGMELRQGGAAADEESAPDERADLAQSDTQLIDIGQFRWLAHRWSVAQCAVSLKVSPRNLALSRDGRLHVSPVAVDLDATGWAISSSRGTADTVRHLRRDPRAALCVFVEAFPGLWVQTEGTAEVVAFPEAMALLVDDDRRLAGAHPDGDDSRWVMTADWHTLLRLTIERTGSDRQGEGDGRSETSSSQRCCAALLRSSLLSMVEGTRYAGFCGMIHPPMHGPRAQERPVCVPVHKHSRGAPMTPGARDADRYASGRGTSHCTRRDYHAVLYQRRRPHPL